MRLCWECGHPAHDHVWIDAPNDGGSGEICEVEGCDCVVVDGEE